ncbi:hypothetical protein [Arenibaculum sp.]|jgi:hypothetical protein|uniref:hypothetical protein n=1 Tax=Arenibaculum sp. TaxID=2865862 RepID=UPI002E106841|nr:hypothetical protein [Arenibaculum sp.]
MAAFGKEHHKEKRSGHGYGVRSGALKGVKVAIVDTPGGEPRSPAYAADVDFAVVPRTARAREIVRKAHIDAKGILSETLESIGPSGAAERAETETARSALRADAYAPDARARAILRGREIAENDLRASGGAYEMDQVRMLMGNISRQAVAKKVAQDALLAVDGLKGSRRYPTVQFQGDGSVVPGLRAVLRALPDKNPWVRLNYLVNPEPRLGRRRPIDLLREGKVDAVVHAARLMGEQGA